MMLRNCAVFSLMFGMVGLGLPSLLQSATLEVPGDYPSIQSAIDAAADGDTVLVASGTYYEQIDYLGKSINVVSESGPEETVIDGLRIGSVVRIDGNNADPGPLSGVILDGFTITGGRWEDGAIVVLNAGATIRNNKIINNLSRGIYISGEQVSPLIENNLISGNQACDGAGVEIYFSSPTIRNNQIVDNLGSGCSGGAGVGIYVGGFGRANITGNLIKGNRSLTGAGGGGIVLFAAGEPEIIGNWIVDNQVDAAGGGMEIYNSSNAYIANNVIANNIAGREGGGIMWLVPSGDQGPVLVNNTIFNNLATEGSAIYSDGFDASVRLVNNVLQGAAGVSALFCGDWDGLSPLLFNNDVYTEAASAYGGECSDMTGSNGNVSMDALLHNPEGGDYSLSILSPLVDGGTVAVEQLLPEDIEGDTRIQGPRPDIGAYETAPAAAVLYLQSTNEGGLQGQTARIGALFWNAQLLANEFVAIDPLTGLVLADERIESSALSPRFASTIGPVSGDSVSDFALLGINVETRSLKAYVRDGMSGSNLLKVPFDSNWHPRSFVAVPNVGTGVGLGVLGTNAENRVRLQLKDAPTRGLISKIPFDRNFPPLGAVVVPPVGDTGSPEVAVMGIDDDGRVLVTVKDAVSGDLVNRLWFGRAYQPVDFGVLPDVDGNGEAEIAVLGRSGVDEVKVDIRDVSTKDRIRGINFDSKFEPLRLVVINDQSAPAVGVLGRNERGGIRVQVKDAASGKLNGLVSFDRKYDPRDVTAIEDTDGNGSYEIAILGFDGDQAHLQMKDIATDTNLVKRLIP